jgi:predicted nucleic acid-binding Zn ribbon protein
MHCGRSIPRRAASERAGSQMAQPLAPIIGKTRFRFTAASEPKRTGPAWYAELVRICARCSKPIPDAKRSHAKYCSDECKTQAFLARRRKKPEQVSVAVAGSPAEPEQKPSVLAGTVSPLGPAPTGAGNPDWYAMEYITTDPAGRRVRVRVQQRVTLEYLPDVAEAAAATLARAETAAPTSSEAPKTEARAASTVPPELPRVKPAESPAGPVPEVIGPGNSTLPKSPKPAAKRGGFWPFGK